MNGNMFRDSSPVNFILVSHINWWHLIKKRICFHQSKIFPLRVDPILGRLYSPGKQTGSHKYCLPLKNMADKDGGVHTPLSAQM